MTKYAAFILGILMVLAGVGIAEARHDDGLEGLIIGGFGGAAIGHVITGTPEGVLVGSVLGGTIGLLVDAGNDRHRVVYIKDRHRHYRHWPGHYYKSRWHYKGDRHYYGKGWHKHRRDHRWSRWDRWERRHGWDRWNRRGHRDDHGWSHREGHQGRHHR